MLMKHTTGSTVKPALREVLATSHVAAVSVAVLFLWSLDLAFRALWFPLSRVLEYLFTAVAILDIPYIPTRLTVYDRIMMLIPIEYLYGAVFSLAAALLLARWVYGMGPLRSLARYRSRMRWRKHA